MTKDFRTLSHPVRKPALWPPNRSDTNRVVQAQKMATKLSTNWEFWIQEVEELCYPCSESKGADQPRGYREADPRPCPRVQNVAPLTRRLIYNNLVII